MKRCIFVFSLLLSLHSILLANETDANPLRSQIAMDSIEPHRLTCYPAVPNTNCISLYWLTGDFPCDSLIGRTDLPVRVMINPRPFLSDTDFIEWNSVNNTIIVTSNACDRLYGNSNSPCIAGIPFVLMAKGEPIYIGVVGSISSSTKCVVPTLMPFPTKRNQFIINRAYPNDYDARGPDPRGDKRIIIAVQELFAKSKR